MIFCFKEQSWNAGIINSEDVFSAKPQNGSNIKFSKVHFLSLFHVIGIFFHWIGISKSTVTCLLNFLSQIANWDFQQENWIFMKWQSMQLIIILWQRRMVRLIWDRYLPLIPLYFFLFLLLMWSPEIQGISSQTVISNLALLRI